MLAAVFIVTTVPLFALLGGSSAGAALFATLALATPAGAWSAACAVAIPEQLPGPVRFTGLALGYNTAVAIFGGLTPLAATLVYDWTGRGDRARLPRPCRRGGRRSRSCSGPGRRPGSRSPELDEVPAAEAPPPAAALRGG